MFQRWKVLQIDSMYVYLVKKCKSFNWHNNDNEAIILLQKCYIRQKKMNMNPFLIKKKKTQKLKEK